MLWPGVPATRRALAFAIGVTLAGFLVSTASIRYLSVCIDDDAAALLGVGDERVRAHAGAIRRAWRRSMHLELTLHGPCLLFGVVATTLAMRALRRHDRLIAGRAEELEEFAGRVAHEVLSPLASLGVVVPWMVIRHPEDESLRRLATRALSRLHTVRSLVEGLLDFARAGARPGGTPHTAIAPVLEELLDEIRPDAERASVRIQVEPFTDCEVACAPGVLASLLGNLLHNALKYIGDGPQRDVTVRVVASDGKRRVEVEDTGPGIPPGLEEKLFEPYWRAPGASGPGIGLGLATVKRLALAHGGAVGVHSLGSRGSLFWFELPLARSDILTVRRQDASTAEEHDART